MMTRTVSETIQGIVRNTYAWRIDTWVDVEGGPVGAGIVEGPSLAPEDLLATVRAGKGERFRLKDADGIAYCKGRFVELEDDGLDHGYVAQFGPLDDYGTGGLGCTSIEFWQKDPDAGTYSWVEL